MIQIMTVKIVEGVMTDIVTDIVTGGVHDHVRGEDLVTESAVVQEIEGRPTRDPEERSHTNIGMCHLLAMST